MDARTSRYHEVYARSMRDPEGFWGEAAAEIDWYEPAKKVFDAGQGIYGRWFAGGVCNTCYNALDRHVAGGRADQIALIYDSPMTCSKAAYSYAELLAEVKTLAAMIADLGVGKGDRVILYMPMVPEAVMAMLACARIGAVHSVVFGGFAAKELATRIDDAKPKLILSASCGLEPGRVVEYKPLLDEAIRLSTYKPPACMILQRPQAQAAMTPGRDHDWASLHAKARKENRTADCVPVLATDPLYILYTSGTTGIPKGVVRDNGGHMVALKWSMKNLYGVEPGETYWCASDVGWVVGHSYIVYGPLLHGCTSILYEGKPVGTPDAGAFWRVISEHGAMALFTAPTAFRAIKKEDPKGEFIGKYDLSSGRARRSRYDPVGGESAEGAGDRSLVADRDRLVHRRQSDGARHVAGEARFADRADAGLSGRCRRRSVEAVAGEQDGIDRHQAADAAGLSADLVAAGRALQGKLSQ
jgi:propionyl-CoA synthetase